MNNYTKNIKSGISVIVLIVTIVIGIIILTAIVLNMQNTDISGRADETSFKNNIKVYETELGEYISTQEFKNAGRYNNTLYADMQLCRYEGAVVAGTTIKDIIPSLVKDDEGSFSIENSKLVYSGHDDLRDKWASDLLSTKSTTQKYTKDSMVLWLDSLNNTATGYSKDTITWLDLSGNKNDGVLSNFSTVSAWEEGGLVFDGVNDDVKINDSDTLKTTGNKKFTIEVVAKPKTIATAGIVSKMAANGAGDYGIWTRATGTSEIIVDNPTSGLTFVVLQSDAKQVKVNETRHIAGVYDGTNLRLYDNGKLIKTRPYTQGINASAEQLTIGSIKGGHFFNGVIYGVRIYDKALSDGEIQENYTQDKIRYGIN